MRGQLVSALVGVVLGVGCGVLGFVIGWDAAQESLRENLVFVSAVDDTSTVEIMGEGGTETVQLVGVDLPRVNDAACVDERRAAYTAANALRSLIANFKNRVTLSDIEPGAGGDDVVRARIWVDDIDVSQWLIDNGYGFLPGDPAASGWCGN